MVCECREGSAFDKEPEVLNGEVHCKELAIEGTVLGLWLAQLLAEEPQRFPGAFDLLLEDGAQRNVGGV